MAVLLVDNLPYCFFNINFFIFRERSRASTSGGWEWGAGGEREREREHLKWSPWSWPDARLDPVTLGS